MKTIQTEVDDIARIDATMERLNSMGQTVRTFKYAPPHQRDWESEDLLDSLVGMYVRNIARHYQEILATPTINGLWGCLKGQAVAVVGAGPGLDKNIEYLRDFPGLIVAVDRAAIPLTAQGFPPDLVVTVDPKPSVIAEMLRYPNSGQALALSVCCDPEIHRIWNGPIRYMSHKSQGTQFFDRVLPALFPGMGEIYVLGNVGNMAVQMAHFMGAGRIVLVGQDYGYTGGRMCAREFKWSESGWEEKTRDHEGDLKRRTGKVLVGDVWTYLPYVSYARDMMRMRETFKLDVVNCTEGGILTDLPRARLEDETRFLRTKNGNDTGRVARTLLAKALGGEK